MILIIKDQSRANNAIEIIRKKNLVYQTDTDRFVVIYKVQCEIDTSIFEIVRIPEGYKLVNKLAKKSKSIIKVGNTFIGMGKFNLIAGPCSVESEEQLEKTANYVSESSATMLRGGIFKPRTSPYEFQGLGKDGLKLLINAKKKYNLPIVVELMSSDQVIKYSEFIDVIQIGARNMQNFDLLKSVGRTNKPVILKRGLSSTINEWLMSAEYIASQGNMKIILCERGIRSFENSYRNVLDINAVSYLKKLTHLPIIVDPSHATGNREMINDISMAAVACGCDGLMLETHFDPDNALSDKEQALNKNQYMKISKKAFKLHYMMKKEFEDEI